MRLFFALPLPDELKTRLAAFQQRSKGLGLPASWPDPQGLHLTLAFLGEQDETCVPLLLEVARRAVASHEAFTLRTSTLGGFPSDRRARILWLGVEQEPRLDVLCARLRQGLREVGQAFDEKPFRAHLTLARFKAAVDIGLLGGAPEPCPFAVRELALLQSVTTPAGSRYRALGVAPLG